MKKRCYGIDIARLLSMFMVVLLHNLNQGGVLDWEVSSNRALVYLTLENYSIVAVNVFSLISGYLSVGHAVKSARMFDLWFSAFFWSVFTSLIGIATGAEFGSWFVSCLFPVCNVKYWYLDAFLAMQLFLPFINGGIERLGKRRVSQLAICLVAVCSLLGFAGGLGITGGYSTLWLLVLWVVGAAIRLNADVAKKMISTKRLVLGIAAIPLLSTVMEWYSSVAGLSVDRWIYYVSPLVVIQAICLFLLCLRIDVRSEGVRRLLETLSPAAFGVYLIDNSTWFYQMWLANRFAWVSNIRILKGIPFVLLVSVAMFVCFLTLESLRLHVQERLKQSMLKLGGERKSPKSIK